MTPRRNRSPIAVVALAALAALASLGTATGAAAAPSGSGGTKAKAIGTLSQLPGARGCIVDESKAAGSCASARALDEPGPFMGSNALALSPDGRNLYVASSKSDAIAVFSRNKRTGNLKQAGGKGGCIATGGADGCATAIGLDGPNSVAVSPDGVNVYATSRDTGAVIAFRRNPKSGALVQPPGGCIAELAIPDCTAGRALAGADVVTVSPDGANVYVGAFFGNAVATFDRDPSTGLLTQPADDTGCITEAPTANCATGVALASPEGMAVSENGAYVYVATAVSNAVVVLARDPSTGALTQAADGTGCITDADLAGCTTGVQLAGANAVAVNPDSGDVYVTSLTSNSLTSFSSSGSAGLTQKPGTSGCTVFLVAVGCSFARALSAPEGVAVSPDGVSVYVAAFASGAIDVLDRNTTSGDLAQKPRRPGCVAKGNVPGCERARKMKGVSSIVISSDGRHVYATASGSDAIVAFKRRTR